MQGIKEERINVNGRELEVTYVSPFNGDIHPTLRSKLLNRDELSTVGNLYRNRGKTVVYTTGVYDMIHVGHARYLEVAKSLGQVLVVGLNSDSSVRSLKGPNRPMLNESRRAEMLSFLESIDFLTIYPEATGEEDIRLLKPDVYLCVEGSWKGELGDKPEVKAMAEHGGRICVSARQEPHLSTTAIIRKISRMNSEEMLARFQELVRVEPVDTE